MTADSPPLTCAVMITTHNRLPVLRETCGQLRQLNPQPEEYLFTADGCSDGTADWLRNTFPESRVFEHNPGKGSVESRHIMIAASSSDLVLSLDDDSYPLEVDAMDRLRTFHSENPEVAVSTFPQRSEEYPATLKTSEMSSRGPTGSFPNSGACFRRDIYLQLPGFPLFFFHAFEEPDYALQCIAAGYAVLHTNRVTIRHHFTTVERNEIRTHHRHARNEFWSVMMRCPLPQMPLVALFKAASQFRYAGSRGFSWILREPAWWWQALRGLPHALRSRLPVPWRHYREWLRLMKPPPASGTSTTSNSQT